MFTPSVHKSFMRDINGNPYVLNTRGRENCLSILSSSPLLPSFSISSPSINYRERVKCNEGMMMIARHIHKHWLQSRRVPEYFSLGPFLLTPSPSSLLPSRYTHQQKERRAGRVLLITCDVKDRFSPARKEGSSRDEYRHRRVCLKGWESEREKGKVLSLSLCVCVCVWETEWRKDECCLASSH